MADQTPASTPKQPSTSTQEPTEPTPGSESHSNSTPLPLPAPPSATPTDGHTQHLDVSGEGMAVKLDHLGPVVVNQDGTISRISNWDKMTEGEKRNTLRIIGKRNKERMETLRAKEGE